MPISNFSKFIVVRKTSYGFDSGTDVRLKFTNEQGKTSLVEMISKNKTANIERFIDETKYIMINIQKEFKIHSKTQK